MLAGKVMETGNVGIMKYRMVLKAKDKADAEVKTIKQRRLKLYSCLRVVFCVKRM